MPERVKEASPVGKYDWNKVSNGETWKFERDKDFTVEPRSLANAARKAAFHRRDKVSGVSIRIRGNTVYVRFDLRDANAGQDVQEVSKA